MSEARSTISPKTHWLGLDAECVPSLPACRHARSKPITTEEYGEVTCEPCRSFLRGVFADLEADEPGFWLAPTERAWLLTDAKAGSVWAEAMLGSFRVRLTKKPDVHKAGNPAGAQEVDTAH